jgi:hypothetical protein
MRAIVLRYRTLRPLEANIYLHWLGRLGLGTPGGKRGIKLTTMELEAAVLAELPSSSQYVLDWDDLFESRTCLSDVIPVGAGCGAATLALNQKLMLSSGCMDFDELVRRRQRLDIVMVYYILFFIISKWFRARKKKQCPQTVPF